MKITKIEKKKRLYLLEIDETDRVYVTEDTIVHFMLSKNKKISPQELENIKTFAQFSHGKNLALFHISFKSRSEHEVKRYLQEHEIEDDLIPDILNNLKEGKWIDDKSYVRTLLNQNLNSGNKGSHILKQKLLQKGIASQLIDCELNKIDFTYLAEKIAQKLYNKYQSNYPQKAIKDKITQNLIAKGFSYDESKIAVSNLKIAKNDSQEESLLDKELEKQYHKYNRKYEGYDLKQRLIQSLMRKGFQFDDINSSLREYL